MLVGKDFEVEIDAIFLESLGGEHGLEVDPLGVEEWIGEVVFEG